jgi:nucleotide-binding universal stress UspA family protein
MVAFERILCPSDFSPFARRALEISFALARPAGAAIRALHVVSPVQTRMRRAAACPAPVLVSEDRERLLEDLDHFTEPARTRGLATEVAVGYGDVADAIVEEARSWVADVIVMGTRGICSPNGWAVGSVTDAVLRRSSCPVLAVPRSNPEADAVPSFRRILCPIDFSEPCLKALAYAIDIARRSGARLTLLHIVEWFPEEDARIDLPLVVPEYHLDLTEDARERMRRAVPPEALEGCDHEELVATGRPYRAILRVCRERQADLVVLGIHGRRAIDRVLAGATVCHVIREAGCPILAVRPG